MNVSVSLLLMKPPYETENKEREREKFVKIKMIHIISIKTCCIKSII